MARNVFEKLANDEPLDEDDVQWARDRGIPLPEEYGRGPSDTQLDTSTTPTPVVQQGPALDPSQPHEVDLEGMSKKALQKLVKDAELDLPKSATKADMIAALSGQASE